MDDNHGHQVMALPHMTLGIRWAKKAKVPMNGTLKYIFVYFMRTVNKIKVGWKHWTGKLKDTHIRFSGIALI